MAEYRCVLIDGEGRRRERIESAVSEATLRRRLAKEGKRLVSVTEHRSRSFIKTSARRRDVLELTQSLSVMVSAGISVPQALRSLADDEGAEGDASLASLLIERLDKGESFADIVGGMRDLFGDTYVGLVAVGQEAGSLERVMPMLASFLVQRSRTRGRMIGSLIYPAIVIVTAVVGIGIILAYALPRLTGVIASIDRSTSADLLRYVAIFRGFAIVIFALLAVVMLIVFTMTVARKRNEAVAQMWDGFLISLPVLGTFLKRTSSLGFCFSMSALLDAGVTMEHGLQYAAKSASNRRFRRAIEKVRESVLRGESLESAFKGESGVFPPILRRWTRVAEQTGKLAQSFDQLRDYFAYKVDQSISRFVTFVEPALILVVGLVLVLLVVFIVLPLFTSLGSVL